MSATQTTTASGFTIIPTWSASLLDSPDKTEFETAAEEAIKKIESVITTNETIKIDFGYGVMPYDGSSAGVGGAESIGNSSAYTWTQVYNAAEKIENSASASAAQKAGAALLTSDNAKYAAVLNDDLIDITRGQALALGLPTSPLTTGMNEYDGWVALGGGPFDWAQNNLNAEDAVSGFEYEITEVLGRTDNLGVPNGNAARYTLLDMFHYASATPSTVGGAAPGTAAGVLDEPFVTGYNDDDVSYFSCDGKTITWQYDIPAEVDQEAEDVADWSTTNTNRPAATDSFDGTGGNAIDPALSTSDWEELAVMGYTERQLIARDDFNGNGSSDVLIQNTAGVVEIGEIGTSGTESYKAVTSLGSQWSFRENGDFLANYTNGFLIENTSGNLYICEVAGTRTTYTFISTLGSQWRFVGAGDFRGNGHDQFLIESASGQLDIGDASSGHAIYAAIGSLGTQWSFRGTGDFLGKGHDQFLIENVSGQLVVGDGSGASATYVAISTVGLQWEVGGVGDFRGEGHDQYLIENGGQLDIGDVSDGRASYTYIGPLGAQGKFVGTGDYTGSGLAGALVESNSGSIEFMTVVARHAQYSAVGVLGSRWTFHS